jgi:exopolysaccharide biosynthesis polyprenyl glycosylphosphotransferase
LTIGLATAIWATALRTPYQAPGRSALALGTTVMVAWRTLVGLVVLSFVVAWAPFLGVGGPELLAMTAAVFAAACVFGTTSHRTSARRCRLLLVGCDESIRGVVDELEREPRLPFDVVGIVDDSPCVEVAGVPVLGSARDLSEIVRDTRSDLVVLGSTAPRAAALAGVFDLGTLDVRVVNVHHFSEHAFGKVSVAHLSPEWFMGVLHLYQRPYSRLAKRAFDVVVASIALVLAAPVMAIVSIAVRASGPGPIFFRQLRLGEAGRQFEVCKFRTMIERAEEPGVAVWAGKDDARVTRVGSMLRRTRLDELPQLWNVLRGDMSVVGPRPERPEFLELLSEAVPFWTRRNLVKPGITGWAQIRQGYTADVNGAAEKLAYDLYYLKYRSLLFDIAITSRTFGTVLTGFGSR